MLHSPCCLLSKINKACIFSLDVFVRAKVLEIVVARLPPDPVDACTRPDPRERNIQRVAIDSPNVWRTQVRQYNAIASVSLHSVHCCTKGGHDRESSDGDRLLLHLEAGRLLANWHHRLWPRHWQPWEPDPRRHALNRHEHVCGWFIHDPDTVGALPEIRGAMPVDVL